MAEAPPAPRPPVYQPPPVRTPRPALRAFTTLLAILLLVGAPLVAGYLTYKHTVGEHFWPITFR